MASALDYLPGAWTRQIDPRLPQRGVNESCGLDDEQEQVCQFPLRGGTRMRSADTGSGCSSGVNAYSRSDGRKYIVTAGHCFSSGGQTDTPDQTIWNNISQSDFVDHIGIFHRVAFTGHNTQDWGDIAIYSSVSREAAIDVEASTGERPSTANPDYPVHGSGGTTVGGFYCKSGSSHGTGCGQVIATGETNAGISNLAEINLVDSSNNICEGDSGGPVFAGGIVYGIAVSGFQPDGQAPDGASCNDYAFYVGIAAVLNDLNLNLNVQ